MGIMKIVSLFAAVLAIKMGDDVSDTLNSLAQAEKEMGAKMNKIPLTPDQERKMEKRGHTNYMTTDYKHFLADEEAHDKEEAQTLAEAVKEVVGLKARAEQQNLAQEATEAKTEAELDKMELPSRKVNFSQEEVDATEELVQTSLDVNVVQL